MGRKSSCEDFRWHDGRGNLSFVCNNASVAAHVEDWINSDCGTQPMCIQDVCTSDFYSLLMDIKEWKSEEMAYTAFPAEMAAEKGEEEERLENVVEFH